MCLIWAQDAEPLNTDMGKYLETHKNRHHLFTYFYQFYFPTGIFAFSHKHFFSSPLFPQQSFSDSPNK